MADRDHQGTVGAMMLVAGGVIGAGLALLFAPQSGKKTRKQLVRYGQKVRNEAEAATRETAENLTHLVEDLSDRVSDIMAEGGDVADEWRKNLLDSIEKGQKNLEKQRKRLADRWG